MWRDDAYLLDILLAAKEVRKFTTGVGGEQFQKDRMLQNAVMYLIQKMGEAATKVSAEFKVQHPEIPWQGMIGMRHRLVHDYFNIIPEKVWGVVEMNIPALIPLVEPLVPPDDSAGAGTQEVQ